MTGVRTTIAHVARTLNRAIADARLLRGHGGAMQDTATHISLKHTLCSREACLRLLL